MKKILLIEDDQSLGPTLQSMLVKEGYQVKLCNCLALARQENYSEYDLVLLDWMLPDGQGVDFLKEIDKSSPTIMLTARTDLIDKVLGLESGANDYITKPFESRELLARIRVQLRLPQSVNSSMQLESDGVEEFISKNLKFSLNERKVFFNSQEVIFTKMEFDLLYLLTTNPKQVFSREKLLDQVWGYDNFPTTRTVDTHVLQIRQKISADIIETIRGIGYRFNPEHN